MPQAVGSLAGAVPPDLGSQKAAVLRAVCSLEAAKSWNWFHCKLQCPGVGFTGDYSAVGSAFTGGCSAAGRGFPGVSSAAGSGSTEGCSAAGTVFTACCVEAGTMFTA